MYLIDFDRNYDILFGEIDNLDENGYVLTDTSYDTFHLIPDENNTIEPPSVRSEEIDIPGAMGSRMLVNFLTGYPIFTNRSGELAFISFEHTPNTMARLYRKFHGRRLNLVMPTNREYYYTGYFEVSKYTIGRDEVEVNIKYTLEPYLYSRTRSDIVLTAINPTATITLPENTQPYMPKIFYSTQNAESPLKFQFTNPELDIQSAVLLDANQYNYLGCQCVLSGFNATNEIELEISDNNGASLSTSNPNAVVTVEYRHTMV